MQAVCFTSALTLTLFLELPLAQFELGEPECPGLDYTLCSMEGVRCNGTIGDVVAYGSQDLWSYTEMEDDWIDCDKDTFGEIDSLQGDPTRRCCILTESYGEGFPNSPVIGTIGCNGRARQYVTDEGLLPNYWQFELDTLSLVTVSNCESEADFDFELRVFNATGYEYNDEDLPCDGEDCGFCGEDEEKVIYSLTMQPGTYFIEADESDDGQYILDVTCEAALTECPRGYTYCADEGENCTTTVGEMVAYGLGEYSYVAAQSTQTRCVDNRFGGDPAPAAGVKQCCIADMDFSDDFLNYTDGIVIGDVNCGEQVQALIPDDNAEDTYWRFQLNGAATVTFSNCETYTDTRLYVYNATGFELTDDFEACDGDDCGVCGDYTDGEEFVMTLPGGTYFVGGDDDFDLYKLTVTCGPVDGECPDGFVFLCNEGDNCTAPTTETNRVVAYGNSTQYTFMDFDLDDPTTFLCNEDFFDGDPAPFVDKQCCILNEDFQGSFPESPVVASVSCGDYIETYTTDDGESIYYYRFVVDTFSVVNFDNCDSQMDTEIHIYDETGRDVTDELDGTGEGDDGGRCYHLDREQFQARLDPGTYYIEADADGDEGFYRLNLTCFDANTDCPDNYEFCAAEGDTCATNIGQVVAYGTSDSYTFINADSSETECNNASFGGGNPHPLATSQCCRATQNFSMVDDDFDENPVIGSITCGDEGPFTSRHTDGNCGPFFWRLDLDVKRTVTIGNCKSVLDTNLYLHRSNGTEFDDPDDCSGDDCDCPFRPDSEGYREIIRLTLDAGTYYIEIGPNSCDDAGDVLLDVDCLAFTEEPTSAPTGMTEPPSMATMAPSASPTGMSEPPTAVTMPPSSVTGAPSSSPISFAVAVGSIGAVDLSETGCPDDESICLGNGESIVFLDEACSGGGRRRRLDSDDSDDGDSDDSDDSDDTDTDTDTDTETDTDTDTASEEIPLDPTAEFLSPLCVTYSMDTADCSGDVATIFLPLCGEGLVNVDISLVGVDDVNNAVTAGDNVMSVVGSRDDESGELGVLVVAQDFDAGSFELCFEDVVVTTEFNDEREDVTAADGGVIIYANEETCSENAQGLPCLDIFFGCEEDLIGPAAESGQSAVATATHNCDCSDGMESITLLYSGSNMATRIIGYDKSGKTMCTFKNVSPGETVTCSDPRRDVFQSGARFKVKGSGHYCLDSIATGCYYPVVGETVGKCDRLTVVSHVDGSGAECDEDVMPDDFALALIADEDMKEHDLKENGGDENEMSTLEQVMLIAAFVFVFLFLCVVVYLCARRLCGRVTVSFDEKQVEATQTAPVSVD